MGRTARLVISSSVVLLFAVVAAPAYGADHPVDVQDNEFVPAEIEVTEGDRVVWTQSGSNPHSVTSDDGEEFDSHPNCFPMCMQQGQSFEHTFDDPGEYPYYCRVHGGPGGSGMSGVVTVQAAAQESPSETTSETESPTEDTTDTPSPDDTTSATPGGTETSTASPAAQPTGAEATPSPLPETGGGNRGAAAVAALAALTVGGGWLVNARRRPAA